MRVRAGESPEEIAEQSGMPLDRVHALRLRGRAGARPDHRRGPRRPGPAATRPTASSSSSASTSIRASPRTASTRASVTWDSYRNEDGVWVISAGWHGGDLKRVARWSSPWPAARSPRSTTPPPTCSRIARSVRSCTSSTTCRSRTRPIRRPGRSRYRARDQLFDQNASRGVLWPPSAGSDDAHGADDSDSAWPSRTRGPTSTRRPRPVRRRTSRVRPGRGAAAARAARAAAARPRHARSPTTSTPPGPGSRPGTTSCSACAASETEII